MSNLDDLKNLSSPPPSGWNPGVMWDGEAGYVTTPLRAEEPTPDEVDDILRTSRLDPEKIIVDWTQKARITSQINGAGELVQCWYKLPIVAKPDRTFDVERLVERIYKKRKTTKKPTSGWRTIVLSDQHIGKSREDGGGSDIIADRWIGSIEKALVGGRFEGINLVLAGDAIEGYTSQNGSGIGSCDLRLREQIEFASDLLLSTIDRCLDVSNHVIVSTVPANHTETTRVAKVSETDSFDILISRIVQMAISKTNMSERVSFYYPERNSVDVTYEAGGAVFCVVHGHKFSGNPVAGAEKWWQGQIVNSRPPAGADIMIHGHYHSFRAWALTSDRWILSAPSLETESAWFKNATGASSPWGVLVFDLDGKRPTNIRVVSGVMEGD